MSMEDKTGGPAFPTEPNAKSKDGPLLETISLRDYFAAKAMQSLVAGWANDQRSSSVDQGVLSDAAYRIADAMRAERDKTGE